MAGEVRDRMVEGAMALLARHGLQATSFSEVIAATGAPRGSLYHHFPGGKDQLVAAAVQRAGALLTQALEHCAGSPADAVAAHFLAVWRTVLQRSNCAAGCAVLAVTVATDSADLVSQAAAVFRGWRDRLAALLQEGGLAPDQASRFATMLIASVEGAVVLSRADQSIEPFEMVASQLLDHVRHLQQGAPSGTRPPCRSSAQ
jgi:TetR/AcrR family transcriptional repressor of lmrAB and yxaGH operons